MTFSTPTKVSAVLVGLNGVVYLLWQSGRLRPAMYRILTRHAVTSMENIRHGRYHTLLTSAFSHAGLIHLGMNMMALTSFVPIVLRANPPRKPATKRARTGLTVPGFAAVYLVAGVVSSVASLLTHRFIHRNTASLGASGAIFAILTLFCLEYPNAHVRFMFAFDMTDPDALLLATAINVGLVVMSRYRHVFIDGAGHLGGTLVGAAVYGAKRANILPDWVS
jgi:rhomboid-like protein